MSTSSEQEVETVPQIHCEGCKDANEARGVETSNTKAGDQFRCVMLCHCGEQTFFEIKRNILTFISGKYPFGTLNPSALGDVRERLMEAKTCYFATALRASAVMARSAIESALIHKGFNKGTLEERIEEAHWAGTFEKREYLLAHGSRIVGNDSIHKADIITPVEAETTLAATVQILNGLFP